MLAYLRACDTPPTAEEIYTHVLEEIPSLSRATVYNTLHLFAEAGLVRVLDTVDGDTRYDAELSTHGHFRCDRCGALYDFNIDLDHAATPALQGFEIRERHATYKGLCPDCLAQQEKE